MEGQQCFTAEEAMTWSGLCEVDEVYIFQGEKEEKEWKAERTKGGKGWRKKDNRLLWKSS